MEDKYGVKAQILPEPEEEEIWVPAPGFEDRYEVSSFGNLRHKNTERLRKIRTDNYGYPCVCLKIDKKVHFVSIHRLVCEAFNGPPTPEYNICDHRDRCIVNNYYRNLRWTDASGNKKNSCGPLERVTKITRKNTPVVFLNNNDELQQRFDSIEQAHKVLGFSICQIEANTRGHRKSFKDGYFLTEEEYLSSFAN